MIIVAGARNLKEAGWLFANGAGEVYCLPDRPPPEGSASGAERALHPDLAKKRRKTLFLLNQSWQPGDYGRSAEVRRLVARGVEGLL